MSTTTTALALAAALVTVTAAAGGTLLLTKDSRAETVDLRTNCAPERQVSIAEAAKAVSAEVGFEVKVPAALPSGYRVTAIEEPCGMDNPWKPAHLVIGHEDPASDMPPIAIDETPTRITPAGPERGAEPFDIGAPAETWLISRDAWQVYTVLAADRAFIVMVGGPEGSPPQPELAAMMRSLVE